MTLTPINLPVESSKNDDIALIAVIDGGIDILHSAFLDSSGNTKILSIWDQTNHTGSNPNIAGFTSEFGTEHTRENINSYVKENYIPPSLKNLRGIAHGTQVASIAAGIAPNSQLIIVIPEIRPDNGDGSKPGTDNAYTLALLYIKYLAKQHNRPVVINISLGTNAGAHDGTSLLEVACDRISDNGTLPGLVIVKSAGNERNKKSHAELLILDDTSNYLSWKSIGNNHKKDTIEFWFKSCNLMQFRLINPQNEPSIWILPCKVAQFYQFKTGDSCQFSYVRYPKINENSSKFTIVITSDTDSVIEKGDWKVEIQSISTEDPNNIINAWIQYANWNQVNDREIQFIDSSDKITLTIPGTAKSIISVASVSSCEPFNITSYSSFGPTRDGRCQPILAAPGENVMAAIANSSNQFSPCNGTSMAAPHITGIVALLLSKISNNCMLNIHNPNYSAHEIQKWLRSQTRSNDEKWRNDIGYGVLDVQKLITEMFDFTI